MARTYLLNLLDSSSDDDSDFEFDMLMIAHSRRRSIWVENHIKNRKDRGEFNILKDLSEQKFHEYFKMSREVFDALHSLVQKNIEKQNTNMRQCIFSKERLAVCLRYLSTGASFRSIGHSYRMGASTISKIVAEVCDALWLRLQPMVLKELTQAEWKQIAIDFKRVCQFDHCCGAIDGKHVVIQCPPNSGSTYFNYKKTFSIVLLAVCDSQRKFTVVDIGSMGRFSDSGILSESEFGEKLKSGNIRFPDEEPLYVGGINMPYVLVGDEAFPLLKNLMRPYPKERLTASRRMFNYRLSRARRVIENAFGALASRFRIYRTAIACKVDLADKIVKATVVLHNYFIQNTEDYPSGGNDAEPIVRDDNQLVSLSDNGFRYSNDSFMIREEFCHYFNSSGSLPWQANRIQRRLRTTRH